MENSKRTDNEGTNTNLVTSSLTALTTLSQHSGSQSGQLLNEMLMVSLQMLESTINQPNPNEKTNQDF